MNKAVKVFDLVWLTVCYRWRELAPQEDTTGILLPGVPEKVADVYWEKHQERVEGIWKGTSRMICFLFQDIQSPTLALFGI